MPNVPTMAEAGFPDFAATAWYGVFAPSGVPLDIQDQLEKFVDAAARSPEFQKFRATLALDYRPLTAKEFAVSLPADSARWRQVITRSKIVLD
jgi:tripartite-type tricarboxylate transporter receptor subunit TctC